ncbi:MAG TPA: hypothetical protein V6D17_11945 [Candidatus Obscuribacterales bacterium]
MAEEDKEKPKSLPKEEQPKGGNVQAAAAAHPAAEEEGEHYEVVSEYRIGEGPPPLFLVVAFAFIVLWAMFSWIPFFGY